MHIRILLVVLLLVLLNVVFYATGAAAWTCDHFPWSKGCWGHETAWSHLR